MMNFVKIVQHFFLSLKLEKELSVTYVHQYYALNSHINRKIFKISNIVENLSAVLCVCCR